ncbi:hypothetical protein DRO61_10860 [Candidatus Bathyarchaeota archaeon]|nr:MAG: hypothetical protein DRO61_10860 [Candidatus Bathyarchaeota archaeon]
MDRILTNGYEAKAESREEDLIKLLKSISWYYEGEEFEVRCHDMTNTYYINIMGEQFIYDKVADVVEFVSGILMGIKLYSDSK